MSFLDRLFGKNRTAKQRTRAANAAADQARSQKIAGRETGQTAAEQAHTRGLMEAEMDAQRQRRADAANEPRRPT